MKALVIGLGSIGRRHVHILQEMGCKVSVVSRQNVAFPSTYSTLETALREVQPEYVVVATRTSEHSAALSRLAMLDYRGIVLVEKPLFVAFEPVPAHSFAQVFVGYNLRFHPLLQGLRAQLESEEIISVQAYVGQYLPNWREGVDYRSSYSARKREGGGVLRDLSHELDYLMWLFGHWTSVTAVGGKFSALEIDSDDLYTLILTTARCPAVSVQLNYLDRKGRRFFILNTGAHTIAIDFMQGQRWVDGQLDVVDEERDHSYRQQHEAVLSGRYENLCTLEEGLEVMRVIEAAERAAAERVWICR